MPSLILAFAHFNMRPHMLAIGFRSQTVAFFLQNLKCWWLLRKLIILIIFGLFRLHSIIIQLYELLFTHQEVLYN